MFEYTVKEGHLFVELHDRNKVPRIVRVVELLGPEQVVIKCQQTGKITVAKKGRFNGAAGGYAPVNSKHGKRFISRKRREYRATKTSSRK